MRDGAVLGDESRLKAMFPDTSRGRHSFTLTYSGNATTRAAHATVTVTRG